MYPHQAERLTEALVRAGLDGLVATSPANVAYVTGFRGLSEARRRSTVFGIFTRHGTGLVVPALEVPSVVADRISVDHIVCFGALNAAFAEPPGADARRSRGIVDAALASAAEGLAAALEHLGIRYGSIGVDESGLPYAVWQHLSERLFSLKLVPAAAHLAQARRVKSPYEIECLGHALRIAEEALDAVIQAIDRGMTEREAAILFSTEVMKRGGSPSSPLIAFGERAAIPATWPSDRALGPGDLVRVDVACAYKGYHGSVARTAVLGQPTVPQETAHRAIQAGIETAVATVTPGRSVARAFQLLLDSVRASGLPRYDCAETGHGIGLEPFEPPTLTLDDETAFEMGEVVRLEASYLEIGSIGVVLAETVLVTNAGARVLNRSQRGLVVLD
jgi:Xaa-Pro dipeptidase